MRQVRGGRVVIVVRGPRFGSTVTPAKVVAEAPTPKNLLTDDMTSLKEIQEHRLCVHTLRSATGAEISKVAAVAGLFADLATTRRVLRLYRVSYFSCTPAVQKRKELTEGCLRGAGGVVRG